MSAVATAGPRAQLEARAGASDVDRAEWLAQRRQGVTATEVRDLWLGKLTVQQLVEKKLGPAEPDLSHIPAIAWGNRREPIIAARLQRSHGMAPESRVFCSAENERWLASPDGLALDFDERIEVSEIKTAGMDIAPGTADFDRKGYLAQMVWSMGVLGAWRCLYAWEERIGDPFSGYTPGLLQTAWIEFADHQGLWLQLQGLAGQTLEELDRRRAGGEVEAPEVREDVDTAAVNYLRALELEKAATETAKVAAAAKKAATEAKAAAFAEVRALAGAGELVQESLLARVTKRPDVQTEEEERVLDVDAPQVQAARLRLEKAQANLERVEGKHTTVRMVPVVKPGSLTITSPQKRKQKELG